MRNSLDAYRNCISCLGRSSPKPVLRSGAFEAPCECHVQGKISALAFLDSALKMNRLLQEFFKRSFYNKNFSKKGFQNSALKV